MTSKTVTGAYSALGLLVEDDQHESAPKIQQSRYRRACYGELIQIDGCTITGSKTVRPPVAHWSTSTIRRAA